MGYGLLGQTGFFDKFVVRAEARRYDENDNSRFGPSNGLMLNSEPSDPQ